MGVGRNAVMGKGVGIIRGVGGIMIVLALWTHFK